MNAMKLWMTAATTAEQSALARRARTSRAYLYQLAVGDRVASAELARRLELAAETLAAKNPALPSLGRESLCPACGRCEYAKAALTQRE